MKHSNTNVVGGLILIFLGLVFLLPGSLGNWWPLLLIAMGAYLTYRRSFLMGLIFLGIGLLFQASNLLFFFGVIPVRLNLWNLWPLLLVFIGLWTLFGRYLPGRRPEDFMGESDSAADYIEDNAIFWGSRRHVSSDNFKGGKVNAIFGGSEIDLRDAQIAKSGADLEVNAVFGGIQVWVPEDVRVISNGTGVIGGFEDKSRNRTDSKAAELRITGSAVFGGVEIK